MDFFFQKVNLAQTLNWGSESWLQQKYTSSLFMHTCISWTWSNFITDYDHFRISQSLPLTQLQIQHFQFFVTQSSSRRACIRIFLTKLSCLCLDCFLTSKCHRLWVSDFVEKQRSTKFNQKCLLARHKTDFKQRYSILECFYSIFGTLHSAVYRYVCRIRKVVRKEG